MKVLKDPLAINGLLRQKPSRRQHRKTSVLKFSRDHEVELLRILRLDLKRVEANVSGVLSLAKKTRLIVRSVLRIYPTNLGALGLSGADESNDESVPAARHLCEVRDRRAGYLPVEQERASLNSLASEESNDRKHGNTSVGHLGLPITLKGLLVGLLGKAKRIPEAHGGKGSRKVVGTERIEAGGCLADLGGGEGGGRADESEGGDKLHHYFEFVLVIGLNEK